MFYRFNAYQKYDLFQPCSNKIIYFKELNQEYQREHLLYILSSVYLIYSNGLTK